MARVADTIEHVDKHTGCVSLAGRPAAMTLASRPVPVDRPFGGISPRYRFSDDLDGKHRSAVKKHVTHFQSVMVTETGGHTIVQENGSHIEFDQ